MTKISRRNQGKHTTHCPHPKHTHKKIVINLTKEVKKTLYNEKIKMLKRKLKKIPGNGRCPKVLNWMTNIVKLVILPKAI